MLAAILFTAGITAGWVEKAALFLWICGCASYLAMNFTGSTPFTSLSGVAREMRRGLPFQIGSASLAALLWLAGAVRLPMRNTKKDTFMHDFRYLDNTAILRLTIDLCIGCGNCELVCPHRIFRVREGKAAILDPDGCMECGACAKNCPTAAIQVNPDDGCGCAAYIINSWIAKIRGKAPSGCGG